MYKNKKGFTVVELVIVVAVLALLVAILIPTFTDLIRKANLTKDTQLCRILNEDIGMGVTDEKLQEHATFNDVIEYLAPRYTLQNLTPTSNGDIVWDQNTNTFSLIENGKFVYVGSSKTEKNYKENGVNLNLWKVVSSIPAVANQKYSLYLKSNVNIPTVNVVVGFDVGTNANVKTVNYDRSEVVNPTAQTVVIRTNSDDTVLTINAPLDVVKHYGVAEKIDVVAIAQQSYHENGTAQLIAVKKGHIELESNADVSGIYVYNNSQGETKDTSFEQIKITVNSGVEVPKLSRSAVEIQDEGTKVCTIVTDQAKDVYLFNQGIYEQIKTVDEGKNVATDASSTWADSSSNSENTQTAAQQLANEWNGSVAPVWSPSDETRELKDITNKEEALGVEAGATEEEIAEAIEAKIEEGGKSVEQAEAASTLEGNGTINNPFIVYNYETMQKISNFYDLGYYYFEVDMARTDNGRIDCRNTWTAVNINGSFDGNGVVFNNVNSQLFRSVGNAPSTDVYTIKEATINANINISGYGAAVIRQAGNNLVLDNITVHGYIEGNNGAAAFVCFGPGNIASSSTQYMNWIFRNCYSDATIVATGDQAVGFVKHPYCAASQSGGNATYQANCLITIEDSIFEGKLSGLNKNFSRKYFVGNANDMLVKTVYSEEFLETYGNPEGNLYATPTKKTEDGVFFIGNYPGNGIKISAYADYGTCCDNYIGTNAVLSTTKGTLPAKYSTFTVTKASGAVSAKATLEIAPNDKTEKGSYLSTFMTEVINLAGVGSTFTTDTIKYFDITVNGNNVSEQGLSEDEKTYNIYDAGEFYGTTYGSACVRVTQYDANGNVINITTFTFAK